MGTGLEHLLAEGVISEVLARLQSGKEAEVYVVSFGGRVVAAKVYKDRATRSFKNNSEYKEGRTVRNSRSQRAIERGSKFGKSAAEDAWKTAEADALYKLHAAEVRVPTPVLYLDGVLLMELVLNAEGNAARRLIDTDLTVGEANAAYHDMVGQLVRILACDLIHGDLSPYNVLWAAAGPTVIDFPQIISASHNSSSERFFLRDADNILGHFARIDPSLQARRGDPWEIWQAYRRRELTPDFRPTGRSARQQFQAPRPMAHLAQTPQHAPREQGPGGPRPQGPRQPGPRPERGAQPQGQPQHGPRRGGGGGGGGGQAHGPRAGQGGQGGQRGQGQHAQQAAPRRTGPEILVRRPSLAAPPGPSHAPVHAPAPPHPQPHAHPQPQAQLSSQGDAPGGADRPQHRRRRRRR